MNGKQLLVALIAAFLSLPPAAPARAGMVVTFVKPEEQGLAPAARRLEEKAASDQLKSQAGPEAAAALPAAPAPKAVEVQGPPSPRMWESQLTLLRKRLWTLQDQKRSGKISKEAESELDKEIAEIKEEIGRVETRALGASADARASAAPGLEQEKSLLQVQADLAQADCEAAKNLANQKKEIYDSWIRAADQAMYGPKYIRIFDRQRALNTAAEAEVYYNQAQSQVGPVCSRYDTLSRRLEELRSQIDRLKSPEKP